MSGGARGRKGRRGITLIELLVTMGILVIVIGMAGSAMLQSVRSYALTRQMLDDQYNVSMAMLAISREAHRGVTNIDFDNTGDPTLTLETPDADGEGVFKADYILSGGELTQSVSEGASPVLFVSVRLQDFIAEPVDAAGNLTADPAAIRKIRLILTGEYGLVCEMMISLTRFVDAPASPP